MKHETGRPLDVGLRRAQPNLRGLLRFEMSLSDQWIDSALKQIREGILDDSNDKPIVELLEMCAERPSMALKVIYEIVDRTSERDLLAYLGAGPLEDLLVKHPELLERVSTDSINNAKLRHCLGQVDLDDI